MEAVQRRSAVAFPVVRAGTRMSKSQFVKWIESLDENGDGELSWTELEKGLRRLGFWFSRSKAKKAINHVDSNNNGIIDTDEELRELIEYAQANWGIIIYDELDVLG